ncbi:MAG: SDR family oxidoreductase [Ilumatobacter sp.]|uniref:SDR family NAD(P)-dependent oxidoreductase n=1 Tax=Ilumatobacter sp. TaxID=1967498 RepID=UPI003C796A03
MNQLEGRVAIVTGAAQGIGRAFAERLVAEGCAVVVTDRQESIVDVAAAIGATGHVGDVADAAHVRSVVDATVATHGTVDVMVSNAGEVWPTGPLDDWDRAAADFDQIIGSNTKGAFLFGRAVAPIMVEGGGGDIVNISSDHVKPGPGCHPHHGHGAMDLYNAAKWALNGLTFDWARALSRHHVRVNNICMGATDTEMLRGWIGDDPPAEAVATWMQPAQIAQILVELLQEGPGGRTGNSIGLYAGEPCVLPAAEPL